MHPCGLMLTGPPCAHVNSHRNANEHLHVNVQEFMCVGGIVREFIPHRWAQIDLVESSISHGDVSL